MPSKKQEFCFCTLALGTKYRALAQDLAADVEKFSSHALVILTDKPQDFSQSSQVQVFGHVQQSVGCYQDKRYVIAKALSLYNSCLFLDADVRILKPVTSIEWQSGISARSCANIVQHYQPVDGRPDRIKRLQLAEKIAHKFNINLEKVKFISEFMFAIAGDCGKEMLFLERWEQISNYFELHGIYDSEGSVMGLAAAAAQFPVYHDEMPGIEFFNDKIDAIRIKKGQVDPATRQTYFDNYTHKAFRERSLLSKFRHKIMKFCRYFYGLIRLRVVTFRDFAFYYQDK